MPVITKEEKNMTTSSICDPCNRSPAASHEAGSPLPIGLRPSIKATNNKNSNSSHSTLIPLRSTKSFEEKEEEDRSPKDLSIHESSTCAGCGLLIQDRYVLLALDRRWHSSCLKCSECSSSLDSQVSCFTRNGKIYCKSDYYRMFVKRCTRCGQGIFATDLVMRARDNIYHLSCFTCSWCNVTLSRGEIFGICGNLVYCRIHYELRRSAGLGTVGHSSPPPLRLNGHGLLPSDHNNLIPSDSQLHDPILIHSDPSMSPSGHHLHHHPPYLIPGGGILDGHGNSNVSNPSSGTGTTGKGGRKGRPRKRKLVPVESNSSEQVTDGQTSDDNCNRSTHPSFTGSTNQTTGPNDSPTGGTIHSLNSGGCGNSFDTTNIPDHNLLDGNSNGAHSSSGLGSVSGRTKRMRTSFKHHQLRTMKQYFAINQNPDAKDLKQLAQKTSLSKRVLQVWFQNARAKWRRNNLKGIQDSSMMMGGHLPSISSLNNHSNESNSQSGTPTGHNSVVTTGQQQIGEPGSVGQISSSISILNPETPSPNGLPSPDGGSSCGGGGHFSIASPSPSLTGSTSGTGNFLSELTGIGGHHHHNHRHNHHDQNQSHHHQHHDRGPGSSGSGSLDQFPSSSSGFKPDLSGFKSSPRHHSPSPTPPMSSIPVPMSTSSPAFPHLSMAQFHSHLRSHGQLITHPGHSHPQLSPSPRSPVQESRFQELY